MRDKPDYYDFDGIRLFATETHLEVLATGKVFTPSKIHRGFLLSLVKNAPDVVTYQKLWKDVWHSDHMDETSRHTIQTTKGHLVNWLKMVGVKEPAINSDAGNGYFLSCQVTPGYPFPEDDSDFDSDDSENDRARKIKDWRDIFKVHSGYIIPTSTFYGFLFLIAAVLEIAYQFEIYGKAALFGGACLMLLNGLAAISAFGLIIFRLSEKKNAFLPAVGLLIGTGLISILLSTSFIPLEPITEATYQTQPALIAFAKNVAVYFLPLGFVFLLLPFYTVISARLIESRFFRKMPSDAVIIQPKWLLIICAGAIAYSFAATNYMLDKLNSESDHHALFVGVVVLRMVVYFGLVLSSLAWYHAQVHRSKQFSVASFE